MMGPFAANWRNSPLEDENTGSDLTASVVLSAAKRLLPVIIAAAPTTALLIKNFRRSTPAGTSREASSTAPSNGSFILDSCDWLVELAVSSSISFSFSDIVNLLNFHLNSDRRVPQTLVGAKCIRVTNDAILSELTGILSGDLIEVLHPQITQIKSA